MVIFSFLLLGPSKTSEALKKRPKFWILDIKVCLKKLGIGSGMYGKSEHEMHMPGSELFTTQDLRIFEFTISRILCLQTWSMAVFHPH